MQEVITDLQTRLSYQEDAIDELNLTVARQQNDLEYLKREVARLKEVVRELTPSQAGNPADEPLPPHY